MRNLHYKMRSLPTPLGGLALGIASLGWCLENAFPLHGYAQIIGAIIAILMILGLLGRFLLHPDTLLDDLKHPVLGSILPTFAMTSMVIAKMLSLYFELLGTVIWLGAIVVHVIFLLTFIYHRARQFSLHHIVPSWFIPPIGLIVADVTCPSPEYYGLAMILLVISLLCYAFMLPVVIYRLIFITEIPDAAKPTIAILAAPASLSLAGYLTIVQEPSLLVISILLGIALLMTIIVYCALFKLLRLPFSPGFAAFTFPLVIGATALYKLSDLAKTHELTLAIGNQLRILANIELAIATAMIVYVCFAFAKFYWPKNEFNALTKK